MARMKAGAVGEGYLAAWIGPRPAESERASDVEQLCGGVIIVVDNISPLRLLFWFCIGRHHFCITAGSLEHMLSLGDQCVKTEDGAWNGVYTQKCLYAYLPCDPSSCREIEVISLE